MIDQQLLASVFEGLLSNSNAIINQSSEFIKSNCLSPNYCVSLMILGDDSTYNYKIRLSAIANLKNTIETFWTPTKNNNNTCLSDQERATLRSSILDGLIRSINDSQIYKTYKQVLGIMINHDYPSVWPTLLDNVLQRLGPSQNMEEIHGCLLALEKIFAKYELEIEERAILDHIITKSIVILQNLAGQMLQNYNEAVAPLLKSILKIYHMAINISFPLILAEPATFQNWMVIVKMLISFEIPTQINSLQNPSKHIYWKNQKWCFKIIIKLIHKYCFKNAADKVIQQVSCLFLKKYAVSFVESVVEILFSQYMKGKFVSDIVLNNCLLYIFYSLRHDETFSAIHCKFEAILLLQIFYKSKRFLRRSFSTYAFPCSAQHKKISFSTIVIQRIIFEKTKTALLLSIRQRVLS